MEFGIELAPNIKTYEVEFYSKLAEDNGFDYVWVTDHYNNRNAFVILSILAKTTQKVKIGTGVTNPFHMSPAVIASAIATINELSGGRAILGIGAGDKFTLEKIGIERKKPLTCVKEAVHIIRKLVKGESVEFNGMIFKFSGAKLTFSSGNVPIYIGAQGPKMLRLASEIGDGVIINASHPKDVKVALESIDAREGFDIAVCSAFSVDKNRDAAIQSAKTVVAFIVASCPREVLDRHGIDEESANAVKKALNDAFGKGKWKELANAVSEEMVDAFSISGTPDDVVERIEELRRLGITQLVVGSPIGRDKAKAIKLIGREIIPNFR